MSGEAKVHYDPREIYSHWTPAVNEWLEPNGVHTHAFRQVYVTVDGDFAGTMTFSTEGGSDAAYAMCYGQKDQILGVPEAGEEAAAKFIASRYRRRTGQIA